MRLYIAAATTAEAPTAVRRAGMVWEDGDDMAGRRGAANERGQPKARGSKSELTCTRFLERADK